jgi:hypothetical protein
MRRILFAVCILTLLPIMAQAYTLVLKDGRRIEVRNQYRLVNDIAVFTLPEGNRMSIAIEKINISETELANGDEPGMFVKNATNPPKVSEKKGDSSSGDQAKNDEEENPIAANGRPGAKRLTNNDFERYRVRREEMARDAARRNEAKTGKNPATVPTTEEEKTASAKPAPQTESEKEAELLAKRRELEKSKEEYWRGRAKTLLTEARVLEEQIAVVQAQLEDNRRNPANQNPNVSVYSSPNYYPYPPIRIGGVPILLGGGGRTTGGSSTVVINQPNPGQTRAMTLQERLTELQLQYQETLIRYDELLEEGRRAGALPGWLR